MTGTETTLVLRSDNRAEVLATLTRLGLTPQRAGQQVAAADEYGYGTAPAAGIDVTRRRDSSFYEVKTFVPPSAQEVTG